MSVHFLLLHDRTIEKEFQLLAAIREFDAIDTEQFQAPSSRQSRRCGIAVKSRVGSLCERFEFAYNVRSIHHEIEASLRERMKGTNFHGRQFPPGSVPD